MTVQDKGIRTVGLEMHAPSLITQFFPSPSKAKAPARTSSRPHTPIPVDADVIDLAQLDQDDEEHAIEEDDFVPVIAATDEAPDSKRKREHLLGPACPLCGSTLGPSTSNQELNDHIDLCLNKDAIAQASKATPQKTKRVKPSVRIPDASSGMLQWLRKGQDPDT